MSLVIRSFVPADGPALAGIYYDAVQIGAAPCYTQAQRDAWCAARPSDTWAVSRLCHLTTFVAHHPKPVGFMAIDRAGYLDMAFVAPAFQGRGVARQLHQRIQDQARNWGLDRMTTYASHIAKPMFQRLGWQVVRTNRVKKGPVTLENWYMIREVTPTKAQVNA